MSVDMESRLREALHARAAEVEADARTWELVQARLRRSRQRRVALAGALAVVGVVAATVAVPAVTGRTLIRFDGPVADQPGSAEDPGAADRDDGPEQDARPEGAARPADEDRPPAVALLEPCHEPATVAAAWTRGGDLWLACANGHALPLTAGEATDRNPAVSPDGEAVVVERLEPGAAHPVLVHRPVAEDGPETVLGGGALPAFAPDGRLAWFQDAGDGTSVLQVGRPFAEPEYEAGVPHPVEQLRGLAWDPTGERVIYGVREPEGLALWTLALDAGASRVVLAVEDGYAAAAFAPDGGLAGLRRGPGGALELVLLDGAVLTGGDAAERTVASGDALVDAGSDALFVAPAGHARAESRGAWDPRLRWAPSETPSWLVGDGASLVLVTDRGAAVHLEGGVDGAAANPAADLAAAEAAWQQARDKEVADAEARRRQADELGRVEQRHREEVARVEQERRRQLELLEAARELAQGRREAATVEQTRRRIQSYAAEGDVAGLRGLMAPAFTYSFGEEADRDAAAARLEDDPDLLARLLRLLDTPHGTVETGEGRLHVWPRAHALEPAEWVDADVAALRSLGVSEERIEAWRDGEGYTGLRAGIRTDGRWVFLVEGD